METPYPLSSAFEAGSSSYLMPDVKPDLNWQGMPKPPTKASKGTPRAKRGGNTNRGGKTPSAPPAQQSFNPDAPPHESWSDGNNQLCMQNMWEQFHAQVEPARSSDSSTRKAEEQARQTVAEFLSDGKPSSDDQDQEYMEPNEQW